MNPLVYVSSTLFLLLGLYTFYIRRILKKISFGPHRELFFRRISKALLGTSIVAFVLGTFYIGIGLASIFSYIKSLDIYLQYGVLLDSLAFAGLASSFLFRDISIRRNSSQDDRNNG